MIYTLPGVPETESEVIVAIQEAVLGIFLVEVTGDGALDVESVAEFVLPVHAGFEVLIDLRLDDSLIVDGFADAESEVEFALLTQDLGDEQSHLCLILEVGGDLEEAEAGGVEELVATEVEGEGGGVLFVLVAKEEFLVEAGVGLIDLSGGPGGEVEVLVADEEVVGEVEALVAGELLPKVDTELVRSRCCGASC